MRRRIGARIVANPTRCADVDGTATRDVDTGLAYGWSSPRVDDRYVYYVKRDALVRSRR